MSRKYFTRKTILLSVCLAFVLAMIINALAEPPAVAMVTGIYGSLMVKRGGTDFPAQIRSGLLKDDEVSTNGSSRATILMRDRTEIKMDRNTRLTIQEKGAKKGLKVALGKIWAKIVKQDANLEILSPHGAAAIEGTEVVYEVVPGRSTCAVVETSKSVRFYNQKSKVVLKGEQESQSTSMTGTLTPAQKVKLDILIAWQKDILKYYDTIPKFLNAFQQVQAAKAASGTGSIAGAAQQVTYMRQLLAELQTIVPDGKMKPAHGKLIGAFDLMIKYLALNPPPQNFYNDAMKNLAYFNGELAKWEANYRDEETKFITSTSYNPKP